jgi:hypothetical protein
VAERKIVPLPTSRLLLVEENRNIADHMARCLVEAGAEVAGPVATSSEALRLLESERICAVLCKPELRGPEQAETLEERLGALQVPTLMVDWRWLEPTPQHPEPRLQMLWPASARALQAAILALLLSVPRDLPRWAPLDMA